jgi:predicted acylesterase/phospholipase RssA
MSDNPYANPRFFCDIVMKGGITSGVVYPGAVLPLAEQYRFRCVGGASAGGIAAAVVAAAEYARHKDGFGKLAELPEELAGPAPGGGPFMLQLFQADKATRPLFAVMISVLQKGPVGALSVVRQFWRSPLLAGAVALASILLGVFAGLSDVLVVIGIVIAVVVLLVGLAVDIARTVGRLPANDFGLCRLGPEVGTEQAPALTGWLHQRIQDTAARQPGDAPLTFADLWAGPGVALAAPGPASDRLTQLLALSRNPASRVIDLQMMTTDLTHGRPMRLPAPYQQHAPVLEDGGALLFSPAEFRRFFPSDVVDHLVAYAPPMSEGTAQHLARVGRADLLRFPIGPDLPVVVATRMTLSFPVLISAIPLYELDYRQSPPLLTRVLFSDGGITSNFPVHFFDAALPTRPTFALNLIEFEPGETPDPSKPCDAIVPPAGVNRPAYEPMAQIDGLAGFFTAIKDAMQNWRDNAQALLPGYRDRVVDIKLAKGEGGLNLTMKSAKITELNERGKCAGDQLVSLFVGDGTSKPRHWNDHRYVRYRTMMAVLERLLRGYGSGYIGPADAVTETYADRVAQATAPPYELAGQLLPFAQQTTAEYLGMVTAWDKAGLTLDADGVPRPPSVLRTVPPV